MWKTLKEGLALFGLILLTVEAVLVLSWWLNGCGQ